MSLDLPRLFSRSSAESDSQNRKFRPILLTLLIAFLVAGSAAAASTVRDQDIESDRESGDSADSLEGSALKQEETIDESTAANNGSSEAASDQGTSTESVRTSGENTSIKIEARSQTTVNGQADGSGAEVTVNGQQVDLPRSGTYREDIRDGDSRTRIRARVDADNTSINISTSESVEAGSD